MKRGIAGLLALSACKKTATEQGVLVRLTNPSAIAGIVQLRVSISNHGATNTLLFPPGQPTAPIAFETSFSFSVDAPRDGQVDIVVEALNASLLVVVANASTSVVLEANSFVSAPMALQPGPSPTGGSVGTGGTTSMGGASGAGGAIGTGGAIATGGAKATGGAFSTGGSVGTGGTTSMGGASGTGGAIGTGGVIATGGVKVTGGTVSGTGGAFATGGSVGTSGMVGTGGSIGTGGVVAVFDPTWAQWPMPNGQVDVTAGAPNLASYTDNGNGTVTDNVTGLMWQQAVPAGTYTWDQAKAYCPTLTLAGHDDWRLPKRIELVSIVDFGRSGPAINTTYFPSTPSSSFWSSSLLAGPWSSGWGVHFYFGGTSNSHVSTTYNVRCVR
jgi:hypothetical protein